MLLGQLPRLTSVPPGFGCSLAPISVRGLQLFRCKPQADMSAFAPLRPQLQLSTTVHAELSEADWKNASDLRSRTLVLAGEEKQRKTCDRG